MAKKGILKKIFSKKTDLTVLSNIQDPRLADKKLKQRNAILEAELASHKSKKEEMFREKQRLKEQIKIEEYILKRKLENKKLEKLKSIKLKFEGIEKMPKFFLKSGLAYGLCMGIFLKDSEDGRLLYYPWIRRGKKDFYFPYPATNLNDFFSKYLNVVSQVRAGVFNSNFDLHPETREPLLRKNKKLASEDNIEVVRIDDVERNDYETEISRLNKKINGLSNELYEAKKREGKYESLLGENELENAAVGSEREAYASALALKQKKTTAIIVEFSNALAELQDAVIHKSIEGKLKNYLMDTIDKLQEKVANLSQYDLRELTEEQISKIVDVSNQRRIQQTPPTTLVQQTLPAPAPKPEVKPGE